MRGISHTISHCRLVEIIGGGGMGINSIGGAIPLGFSTVIFLLVALFLIPPLISTITANTIIRAHKQINAILRPRMISLLSFTLFFLNGRKDHRRLKAASILDNYRGNARKVVPQNMLFLLT